MRRNSIFPNALIAVLIAASIGTSLAHYVNFTDVSGETTHPQEFNEDYAAAQKLVTETKSAQRFLDMLEKYDGPAEIAQLEYTLGLIYGQRTGVVDVKKSVIHFTKALSYRLPEQAYIDALMLRGNASEQGDDHRSALDDYLRGLLACSQYDLSGGWPEERSPNLSWDHRSSDPGEMQKARDYRIYREKLRFKQHVMRQRFYFVDAVKRVQRHFESTGTKLNLREDLAKLSPRDDRRFKRIMKWIKAENQRPWP